MYPPLFISEENDNNNNNNNKRTKKLCLEICGVFSCLSGVCILYLIFFTHIINEEMNKNYTLP